MRFFFENNALAILLAAFLVFVVTLVGVLAPVALIELGWNYLAGFSPMLPSIGFWQAGLLYVALVLMLYISGLVKIELRVDRLDDGT